MPRLLGIDIPNNKRVSYALRYIYGVGPTRADLIIATLGIDPALRSQELSEEQINRIVQFIGERGWKVEGDLRREITSNLKRLQAIKCYRGIAPHSPSPRARPAHPHQRPHPQRRAQNRRRHQES